MNPPPLLLRDLEQIAGVVFGIAVLEPISSRYRAILIVRGVLDGRADTGASAEEEAAIWRAVEGIRPAARGGGAGA